MQTNIYIFRIKIDDSVDTLLSFTLEEDWDRSLIIKQLANLYPNARKFWLTDGIIEIEWDNNPDDISEIVEKLNDPEKYAKD